jgi:hypothetical protein
VGIVNLTAIGLIDVEKDITLNEMVLRLSTDKSVSIRRSALDVWLRKRRSVLKRSHKVSSGTTAKGWGDKTRVMC